MDKMTSLVEDNIGLAYFVANRYSYGVDHDEAVSCAMLGLVKAARSYDETTGNKFATYATICMQNEIRMIARANRRKPVDTCLDAPIGQDAHMSFADLLEDPDCLEDNAVDACTAKTAMTILSTFTPAEQEIVTRRIFKGQKQSEIAKALSLSQSYVSRLEKACYTRLKEALV